ncbi:MAG: response regulator transcription factor [Leptospiraceae bacterium]|nr:response regulator transcription factor [Leptospiraceae bacterium]MCK6381058.1 response regulator transcription factor [Leptospiraceae bacterium]NUM40603.1 response regulator transcription factor [Leptospiraceae bacterium]
MNSEIPKNISIGIIEDDWNFRKHIFTELIKLPFDPKVLQFSSSDEFFTYPEIQKFTLIFLDIGLPDSDGISIIPKILKMNPRCKILVITIMQDEEKIFTALKAGACGYILKTDIYHLGETIELVYKSGGVMTPTIAYKVMQFFQNRPVDAKIKTLTNRENDILNHVIDGMSTREISAFFQTSEGTVRNQLKSIYKKLHVNSKVELILQHKKLQKSNVDV